MTTNLNLKAIKLALEGKWQQAVRLNKEILKQEPNNTEALCRLAKAYVELKDNKKAIRFYRQVLKIDRFSPIAKRALERLKETSAKRPTNQLVKQAKTDFFLEEPGKTKTIALMQTGEADVLCQLDVADIVSLKTKKRSVTICDQEGRYLGRLPDDLSLRLIKLINRGNTYAAAVKFIDKEKLQIFIRETSQSKKNANILSFPSKTSSYQTFLSPKAIPEEPLEIETEE